MRRCKLLSWLVLAYALGFGASMLSLDGIRPYEASPYHRYQAEALLHGHLALADAPQALEPGLVWHNGRVQQVWGLGVGLWLLPFQALWRLFSTQPPPDRMVLGLAFALLAFFSASTGIKFTRSGQRAFGLALIWVVALCPALWTLARASQLVFEETVLYSVIFSLAILVALVRAAAFGSPMDCFLACALGSFAIWVRPTHAVYGFGAVVLACTSAWVRRHSAAELCASILPWLVSLALLAWTNDLRFGSPTSFGHELTLSTACTMYLTRFGNPCRQASMLQALEELLGLLFLGNPRGANAFGDHLFPGQAPVTRWRRLDLTAFDLSYLLLALAVVMAAMLWLLFQRKPSAIWQQPRSALIFSLFAWASFAAVSLGAFYLHYPGMASHYLMDFSPALMALILLGWVLLPSRYARLSLPLLGAWIIYQVASAQVPIEADHFQPALRLALPHQSRTALKDFHGTYTINTHPATSGIAVNGSGWEPEDGLAADVVSLVVDAPQFVELRVTERRTLYGTTVGADVYRARIGGTVLRLQAVTKQQDSLKVRFEVPEHIQARRQVETLFLCFSTDYDTNSRNSERFLFSVSWR